MEGRKRGREEERKRKNWKRKGRNDHGKSKRMVPQINTKTPGQRTNERANTSEMFATRVMHDAMPFTYVTPIFLADSLRGNQLCGMTNTLKCAQNIQIYK